MVSPEAQKILAGINFEYPINAEVEPSDIVKGFGKFSADNAKAKAELEYTKFKELKQDESFKDEIKRITSKGKK